MRKTLVLIGLVLIFAGIISAGSARLAVTTTYENSVTSTSKTWEISSYFAKGENISVVYTWNVGFTELYEGDLPANVTITVNNNVTMLQAVFRMRPVGTWEPTPGLEEGTPIDVYEVKLLQADPDSLYVTDPPMQVGGITQQEGLYKIRVVIDEKLQQPWWAWVYTPDGPAPNPPAATLLVKYVTVVTYPYTVLGPVGAASTVAGVGLAILSTRLPDRGKRERLKSARNRHRIAGRNRKHS